VVICGFGAQGQVLANMLMSPLYSGSAQCAYIAFDGDVARVRASRNAGFNVVYGDATTPALILAAGAVRRGAARRAGGALALTGPPRVPGLGWLLTGCP
jgi:voltage-gated potassium channel Kch